MHLHTHTHTHTHYAHDDSMRITWERRRLDAIIQIFVYAGLPVARVCGNRSL